MVCIYKIDVGANDHIIQLKDGRLCGASNNHTISIQYKWIICTLKNILKLLIGDNLLFYL